MLRGHLQTPDKRNQGLAEVLWQVPAREQGIPPSQLCTSDLSTDASDAVDASGLCHAALTVTKPQLTTKSEFEQQLDALPGQQLEAILP